MTPARRHTLLFLLLAASAAAVGWDRLRASASSSPAALSQAVARPAAAARAAAQPPVGTEAAIHALRPRTDYLADGADAFPPLHPPAPPVVAAVAEPTEPPRPTAPALPFTVIGKKLEAGVWEVYLAQGERTHVVRQGDAVGGEYRVEAIAPTQMTFIYLPLQEKQTLQTGATLHD